MSSTRAGRCSMRQSDRKLGWAPIVIPYIFSAAPAGRQAPEPISRYIPSPHSAACRGENLIRPEYRDSPENASVQRILLRNEVAIYWQLLDEVSLNRDARGCEVTTTKVLTADRRRRHRKRCTRRYHVAASLNRRWGSEQLSGRTLEMVLTMRGNDRGCHRMSPPSTHLVRGGNATVADAPFPAPSLARGVAAQSY